MTVKSGFSENGAVLRQGDCVVAEQGDGTKTYQLGTPACGSTQILNGAASFVRDAAIGLAAEHAGKSGQ